MVIMKAVANHFRSAASNKSVDRYGILSPLLATGDYISTTTEIYAMFKNSVYADIMSGKVKPANANVAKAVEAYKDYVRDLPSQDQALERANPFSTILLALESITGNVTQIEDNFQSLFGDVRSDKPEATLRSSSLVIIGYLEKADNFSTWLSGLVEHMTAGDGDLVPPFRTKELLSKASEAAEFASYNLHKWNYKNQSLLNEVKEMQKKGSDLAIQSESGSWIDDFAHDSQFSPMEQNLMTASLRSPIMMAITWGQVRTKDKIDLLTSQIEWLKAKIVLEQSKLRGMEVDSPEYKRMKKAVDHYASLMSKYEQRIERMRA